MTMKVKAIEKKLKFTKDPNDPYRCVMQPEQYLSRHIKEGASRQMTHPRIVYRELVFRDRGYRIPSCIALRTLYPH
jgi:hypothetical protein